MLFSEYYLSIYNLATDPFTSQSTDFTIQEFLSSVDLPSITSDQLHQLSQPFTKEEILNAIKTLPHKKSPGEDSFNNEYYKKFANILSPYLNNLFNNAASSGSFPLDMLR